MPDGFMNVQYHVADQDEQAARSRRRAVAADPLGRAAGRQRARFENDEAAARFYLDQELDLDQRPAMRGLRAVGEPGLVPDLDVESAQEQPLTDTRLVRFRQSVQSIPVFGSLAVVELDQDRHLLSLDAQMADAEALRRLSLMPSMAPGQALQAIAQLVGAEVAFLAQVKPPSLTLYYDDEVGTWHLAYLFVEVPAAPVEAVDSAAEAEGHGPESSPRLRHPEFDYLVDAHAGTVLLYFSNQPMFDLPTICHGLDVNDQRLEFWGRQVAAGFELYDPVRNIRTLDLGLQVMDKTPLPVDAVNSQEADWGEANRAAISAHVNAMRVYDFYKSELKRDGVDDKGMELVSVVNCVDKPDAPTPVWRNAVWWKNRMWYGQDRDAAGNLRSMARYLDVIAHELTHGVTAHTAKLVYLRQSGALSESFSDIFGVIINNWTLNGPNSDVKDWDWEIGPDFRGPGRPLRDLSNPRRTGHPDHMDAYVNTTSDNGGVHTNSNIHNKAAYNVLTAVDGDGQQVFTPREVAILYYLTLTRLGPLTSFGKTYRVMREVAKTFYAGDAQQRERKLAALQQAYGAVGIQ